MQAEVSRDETVRTINIQITPGSVPDIDITQSYHRKPRVIRPDRAVIVLVDGQFSDIKVHGGLVLKSGTASLEVTDSVTWRANAYRVDQRIDIAPEWVRMLVAEAPTGVTKWTVQ